MAILEQCNNCVHFHHEDGNYCDSLSDDVKQKYNGSLCTCGGAVSFDTCLGKSSTGEEKILIKCPVCGSYTDSLKHFTLPYVDIFMFVFRYKEYEDFVCCPNCMRDKIYIRGFTYNVFLSNILWPIAILPIMIVRLIQTLKKGHSDDLL